MRLRQKESEFKASLGYKVRLFSKSQEKRKAT
jgi:hypothetical protein